MKLKFYVAQIQVVQRAYNEHQAAKILRIHLPRIKRKIRNSPRIIDWGFVRTDKGRFFPRLADPERVLALEECINCPVCSGEPPVCKLCGGSGVVSVGHKCICQYEPTEPRCFHDREELFDNTVLPPPLARSVNQQRKETTRV